MSDNSALAMCLVLMLLMGIASIGFVVLSVGLVAKAVTSSSGSNIEGESGLVRLLELTTKPGSTVAVERYVAKARQEGKSEEDIAATMRHAGWPEEEIKVALAPS